VSINKKYYYLKLKDNFYNTEDIKLLESMKNGYEYSSLYLKLCLLSLKGEGALLYKNRIPYKAEMLSTITGHSIEVVKYAINLFVELEMLTILDNGTIFIDDIQNLIGHGSTEAERKLAYRKKIEKIKKVGHCPDICPPEKEKEKEKEKENRIEYKKFKKPTIKEIEEYILQREKEKGYKFNFTASLFYNNYESKGWLVGKNKMKSWKAAVNTWIENDQIFINPKKQIQDISKLV